MKQKAFFIIFKGLLIKQITHFFESESPTLEATILGIRMCSTELLLLKN